jgi:N-acetylglucosaminyl-diphospho-decaprenol L-rhamnosyltransferase
LNSDTIVMEGAINTLVSFIDAHPQAAAVGPKVLNGDGTIQSKGECFPSIIRALLLFFRLPSILSSDALAGYFPKYFWSENNSSIVDAVIGCCFLIKREALEKIGYLSEAFFMYGEEEEWCYRAKQNGHEVWYVANASIIHLCGSSSLPNRSEFQKKSLIIFYRKTIGVYKAIAVSLINILLYMTQILSISLRLVNTRRRGELIDLKQKIRAELKAKIEILESLILNIRDNKTI